VEFTCTVFSVKLTEIFKVKFCTNHEKFIHVIPNFPVSHTPTHPHVHTHTHTHQQHAMCLRENIFTVPYPVFLLPYEAPFSSSCKFPHKVIKVVSLQQHDVLYGFMYAIYWCFIVCYIFYTKPYTEVWIHSPREKIH